MEIEFKAVGIRDEIAIILKEYKLDDEERKEAAKNKIVRKIKELCNSIDNKNPCLIDYIENLYASYIYDGINGVKSQLAYILSNFRARTPNDKEIKKQLIKIYNSL